MKTPYYVIHKNELDKNFQQLEAALRANWNNYLIGYSYKTNALAWIVKTFEKKGCYSEVVSEDEYGLAKLLCKDHSKIIYNGPIKTRESFLEALKNRCFVNIDASREIDWLEHLPRDEYNLGIRVGFDIEKLCPNESQCGAEGGRFGFCYENGELEKAINRIREKGFEIRGLHLHVSSKTRSVNIYRAIAKLACEIKERYDLSLSFIDIGGGFFGGMPNKPQFSEYLQTVADILRQSFCVEETLLILEPGICVIGSPVSYVTSVIDVKDTTYNRFVVTDGSRTNIDPLMTKKSYFRRRSLSAERPILKKQVICGYTCMEHDRLTEAWDEQEFCVGDQIIYDKVGAYTMCLTPLFIKYFPAVYVEENDTLQLVREAWTPEEYIQKSVVWE